MRKWFSRITLVAFMLASLSAPVASGATLGSQSSLAVELPWKTFSAAAEQDGRGGSLAACSNEDEVFISRLEHKQGSVEDAYMYFFSPRTQRIMWFVFVGNVDGASADAIGVGKMDPDLNDVIPELIWVSLSEAKARWPKGPCDYLTDRKA